MQRWESIKSHKVKRYGLKTSTSHEVLGCLHFFTISRSLSLKAAKYICRLFDDEDHPQATSCKTIYHAKPVICNFCSHHSKTSMTTSKKKKNHMASVAEETGRRSRNGISFFMSVDFIFIQNSTRTHEV